MTEEERAMRIYDVLNYWLPIRWTDGTDWWEIKNSTVTGTLESGGAELMVSKNDAEAVSVIFINAELYGESMLSADAAKARIMAVE